MTAEKEHYLGNPHVKKDGVEQEFTQHQVQEYIKCMQSPTYFAKNYCKVINLNDGLVPFDLYPYQEEMFNHFNTHRFSIVLACRQSGKSISSVAYLLWYAIFHSEKTVAILANKGSTAREMLSRITLMLENLPFFLQPGCKSLNKGSIEFSNNSTILTGSTSSSSIRGFSVNLLYLDEFAFVERDAEFYTSTYPVISSGKNTKIIITSTANGIGNIFHRIWEGAVQRTNEYMPFRVDWWDVPGRDEAWKEQTIRNTSPRQFDQEFGNCLSGDSTVIVRLDCGTVVKITLEKLYQAIIDGGICGLTTEQQVKSAGVLLDDIWITYKTTHREKGQFYIGKTRLSIWERGYLGSGKRLVNAVDKYGKDCWDRTILSYHEDEEEAYLCERDAVREHLSNPLCYNIAEGGKGVGSGELHPNYGRMWSEETNQKRVEKTRGRRRTQQQIENYKKAWTPERREIKAATMRGKVGPTAERKLTDDHKRAIHGSYTRGVSVKVGEVIYQTTRDAGRAFGIKDASVRHRIKSSNFPEWSYT